eukprot:12402113-Heterocapsa_arctica.AAC.2
MAAVTGSIVAGTADLKRSIGNKNRGKNSGRRHSGSRILALFFPVPAPSLRQRRNLRGTKRSGRKSP